MEAGKLSIPGTTSFEVAAVCSRGLAWKPGGNRRLLCRGISPSRVPPSPTKIQYPSEISSHRFLPHDFRSRLWCQSIIQFTPSPVRLLAVSTAFLLLRARFVSLSTNPNTSRSTHLPVMPREVMDALQLTPGLSVMDGTVGAGGHSSLIRKAIGPTGNLIGFDRDPMMLRFAKETLPEDNVWLVHASYADAEQQLAIRQMPPVDRVLLDLGLSSDQLADRARGFGFDAGGPLDMRFDSTAGNTVAEFIQQASVEQIASVIQDFGEDRNARQIANTIVTRRRSGPGIQTVEHLLQCINDSTGRRHAKTLDRNTASRIFQAFRIEVNRELEHVKDMMTSVLSRILKPEGIAVVMTFHSLEDRIVKRAFKANSGWQALTRSPVTAAPSEVRLNPRARSAKLRSARWMGTPGKGSNE
jgi:16S rRNA (cytosine1402-N4)-methyltransferase